MNKKIIIALGLLGIGFYAYKTLNRTKTVYIDSFDVPGLPSILDVA